MALQKMEKKSRFLWMGCPAEIEIIILTSIFSFHYVIISLGQIVILTPAQW